MAKMSVRLAITPVKRGIARAAARLLLPRLLCDEHPFNHLLGRALLLQFGKIPDDEFRENLARFYSYLDPHVISEKLSLGTRREVLDLPSGYKTSVIDFPSGQVGDSKMLPLSQLWRRRFGVLRHLGIRSDVLVLRAGEQIPPHGHYGIVSGFFVLQGLVASRNYDRIRETNNGGIVVKEARAEALGPGGHTTNSEQHNIHWLLGLAERSYLFRVTVSGTPARTFGGPGRTDERVYVDPTGAANAEGEVLGCYVSSQVARKLTFPPIPASASAEPMLGS